MLTPTLKLTTLLILTSYWWLTKSYWLSLFLVKWPPSKKTLRPIDIRRCCECVTKWSIHSSYCFSLGLFFLLSLLFFAQLSFLLFLLSFIPFPFIDLFFSWIMGTPTSLFLFISYNILFFEKFRLNLSESFLYNKLQEFTINYWNSYTYSPFFLLCRLQCIFVY